MAVVPTCKVPALTEIFPVLELITAVVANVPLEMANDAGEVTVKLFNVDVLLLL